MQIRQLEIQNFRGIRELKWRVDGSVVCLIGSGDSTKSTILDSIDFVLSPRWKIDFDDSDFHNGDATKDIVIVATVGDLPEEFKGDGKFGLVLRGWDGKLGLVDEADDDEEHVLSIQLKVGSSLEPKWAVVNNRKPEGVPISYQDREALGTGRIGDFLDRHLTWSKGSVLSKVTGKGDDLSEVLAQAGRAARETLNPESLPILQAAAERVKVLGKVFGVVPKQAYQPHLDISAIDVNAGGLTLHDGDIPLRRAGLGTRRLLTVALQREVLDKGGITLIDEVEHGLEPHRLRRLLRILRKEKNEEGSGGAGQLIMTTHSEIVVDELACDQLRIVRSVDGVTRVLSVPENYQKDIRKAPEAFLGSAHIVGEGATEVGFCRALDMWWAGSEQAYEPLAVSGVVPVDGCGKDGPRYATVLRELEYPVAYFGDSDCPLNPTLEQMRKSGIVDVLWSENKSIEQRIALDLPWPGVLELLNFAAEIRDENKVRAAVIGKYGDAAALKEAFATWSDSIELREAIGAAAKGGDWYKRIDLGERLGLIVTKYLSVIPTSDLAQKVAALRTWIDTYGA
jgi:putative ATP-dependent endonuclease of OLD family